MATIHKRGSTWKKWDLHVHTPASLYQRFGSNDELTWESYVSDLESLHADFSVVGINDYLFLDGYEKLKKLQNEDGRLSSLKLLPVVEFRIDKFAGVQFGSLKRINMHVIFSDEIPIEVIQSQFLNTLEQSYTLESGRPWNRAITLKSVAELGKNIKAQIPASELAKHGSDLIEGFNNLNIPDSAIFGALKKDCFTDKYLIAVGKTEWEDLKWSDSSIATKKSIINSAHIVFTAAKSVDAFHNAKEKLRAEQVNDLLLDCSDAHYLSTSTDKDRIGNCNTWIKAHPTFEGLRQILFEPDHRVKVQVEKPDYKDDKLVIDELRFVSPDSTFTLEPIKLNENLNVIIGGKSSGKSILLFNIARTLLNDRSNDGPLKFRDTEDGEYKYLYEFDSDPAFFDFQVVLKSGSVQSIHRGDDEPSILPDIKYIPQNHLSNLVDRSRKQGNTLKKLIRGLILEDETSNAAYNDFLNRVKHNDIQRGRLIDDYFDLRSKITVQEKDLMIKGDQAALSDSIANNRQKIEQLNEKSGLTPEQVIEYNAHNSELNELNASYTKIGNDFRKLLAFQDTSKTIVLDLKKKIDSLLASLEIQSIKQEFFVYYAKIDSFYATLAEVDALLERGEGDILTSDSSVRRELNQYAARKLDIDTLLEPLKASQESKAQIELIEKSILEDQQKLNDILHLRSDIESDKIALTKKGEEIHEAFAENFNEYEKILSALESRIKSIEGEDEKLEILGVVKYNFPKLKAVVEELTDLRRLDVRTLPLFQSAKTALSTASFHEISSQLRDLFSSIVAGSHPIKKISQIEACKKIYTDFFCDHWEVTSEGDTIHNMSTGKASFVLLKLIIKLSKSKAPILIDQPEDNLDNRSVSKNLVSYLRDKKLERQIILVTHNPNIVVNADAENVIIANQKGQNNLESTSPYKFDYINGALEDSFAHNESERDLLKSMGIRQHIAEIVEGGEKAFKKREQKYCF
jgi:predicted ATP-dependent endonuclease of OLD family